MRILIYSETDAAKARLEELRAEGYRASLRNPHYFNPEQFDKACDGVITDDQAIIAAYASAGIRVEKLTWETTEGDSEPLPPADDAEQNPDPDSSTDNSDENPESKSSADDTDQFVEAEDPASDVSEKPKPKSNRKKSGEAAN